MNADDGVCCEYGEGSFTVTYEGSVVASGGEFDSSTSFTFGDLTCPSPNFELSLLTDEYPEETTWEVIDNCTGAIVLSGGPYEVEEELFVESAILPPSRYIFNIYDEFSTFIVFFSILFCCALEMRLVHVHQSFIDFNLHFSSFSISF